MTASEDYGLFKAAMRFFGTPTVMRAYRRRQFTRPRSLPVNGREYHRRRKAR